MNIMTYEKFIKEIKNSEDYIEFGELIVCGEATPDFTDYEYIECYGDCFNINESIKAFYGALKNKDADVIKAFKYWFLNEMDYSETAYDKLYQSYYLNMDWSDENIEIIRDIIL